MGGTQEPPDEQGGSTPTEWETTEFPAVNFDGYPPPEQAQYPAGPPEYGYGQWDAGYADAPYDPSPYGADTYDQNAYGQAPDSYGYGTAGYGTAGYGAAGYGQPPAQGWPAAPPQPSHRGRNALIAAVAAVVLAGAGVGAYFAFSGSGSGSTTADPTGTSPSNGGSDTASGGGSATTGDSVDAPSSFDGYTEVNNAAAQAAKNAMSAVTSGAGADSAELLSSATVTVYAHGDSTAPSLITFAVPTSRVPGGLSPDEFTKSFLSSASTKIVTVDPGSHGGSARCTEAQFGTVSETLCAWSDSTTSGGVVSVLPALPAAQLSAVQNSFRDAVD